MGGIETSIRRMDKQFKADIIFDCSKLTKGETKKKTPGSLNLSRIDMDTAQFRQCMLDVLELLADVASDYDTVNILFVDGCGTSQSKAIAASCYEVMRSKEHYLVYETVHLSGPSEVEIKKRRRHCGCCRTQSASDQEVYKKAIQIAAELDALPVDEHGLTVGSRTWHTQNDGSHWKPKEKVVPAADDL